jgi:hypothetical protein
MIYDKHFVLPREAASDFMTGLYDAYMDGSIFTCCVSSGRQTFESVIGRWIGYLGLDHLVLPSPFHLACRPGTRTQMSPCRHDSKSVAFPYYKGTAPETWALRHNLRTLHAFGIDIGDMLDTPFGDDFEATNMRFDEWHAGKIGNLWEQVRRPIPNRTFILDKQVDTG